jgi:N-hydroxyarylamine O-acetyltransferase
MYDDLIVELTLHQVVDYLKRIDLPEEAEALETNLQSGAQKAPFATSVEFLNKLVYAHQLAVPFENLEIHDLKKPVLLGTEALFDKIVTRYRGGYCFELNKSFNSLLKALGYQTTSHLGRIQMGRAAPSNDPGDAPIDPPPPVRTSPGPPSHRINLVYITDQATGETKRYMADVSFGGPQPAGAILLEVGRHQDLVGGDFNFYYGDLDPVRGITDETWLLTRISSSGDEQGIVSFEEFRQLEANFVSPNFFTSMNPESRFVTNRTVNLRRRDGHAMVADDTLRVTSDGQTTEFDISDPSTRVDLLKQYFRIVL